ncbi:MAG: hypothetical protein U1F11_09350 [Steroidobacteraceae bacterium]
MFQPLPLFVGLRYVRARTHKFFVSFITWVSLIGVAVGVAALIVILSVMNGFEGNCATGCWRCRRTRACWPTRPGSRRPMRAPGPPVSPRRAPGPRCSARRRGRRDPGARR